MARLTEKQPPNETESVTACWAATQSDGVQGCGAAWDGTLATRERAGERERERG